MATTSQFFKEKEYLKPLPDKAVIDDYLKLKRYKISKKSLIRYGNRRYFINPKFIGE